LPRPPSVARTDAVAATVRYCTYCPARVAAMLVVKYHTTHLLVYVVLLYVHGVMLLLGAFGYVDERTMVELLFADLVLNVVTLVFLQGDAKALLEATAEPAEDDDNDAAAFEMGTDGNDKGDGGGGGDGGRAGATKRTHMRRYAVLLTLLNWVLLALAVVLNTAQLFATTKAAFRYVVYVSVAGMAVVYGIIHVFMRFIYYHYFEAQQVYTYPAGPLLCLCNC